MKDDKTSEKVNTKLGPGSEDKFPEWTLTPADVDIEAMLEEARKQMDEGETLEEFISRTMGLTLDEYIDMTLAGGPAATRQIPPVATQQVDMDKTQAVSPADTQAVDKRTVSSRETRAFTVQQEAKAFRDGMTGTRVYGPFEEEESNAGTDASTRVYEHGWTEDEDSTRTRTASDTRVVAEKIDWKQAENEDAGYKGNDGRTTYGLSDEDVRDTISMARPEGLDEPSDEIRAFTQRIDRRKKDNEKRKMRGRLRVKIILAALVSAIFLFIFSLSSFFTVDAIEVRGNSHYSAEEIINIAHAVPGRNLIYNTGSKEMIEYLEQNPYIKEAVIARKLPSTLVINVTERKQACAFQYDDDYLVMDDEGILLKKTRTVPKITQIKGLVVSRMKLGQVVGTKDKKLFDKMLELIRATNAADMYFVTIDMNPSKDDAELVRAYIYDTFVVKGKYDLLMTNLENGRLHRVVEELFKQGIKRGTITFTQEGTISFEPGL